MEASFVTAFEHVRSLRHLKFGHVGKTERKLLNSTPRFQDDPRVSVSLPPDLAVNQSQSQYPQKGDTYTKEGTGT